MPPGVSRRAALKAFGAGAGAVALLPFLSDKGLLAFERLQEAGLAPAPKVLSPAQFATLEAFVEAIIPTDERSPGAKEARVADYIDLLLSESPDSTVLEWIGGLAELDEEAMTRFGAPFAKLDATQADTLLAAISVNELEPQTPLEAFFVTTKRATVDGYYTSEIGIHQELRYKGNKFITQFDGCDTEDGRDCPHCGQRVDGSQGDRGDLGGGSSDRSQGDRGDLGGGSSDRSQGDRGDLGGGSSDRSQGDRGNLGGGSSRYVPNDMSSLTSEISLSPEKRSSPISEISLLKVLQKA